MRRIGSRHRIGSAGWCAALLLALAAGASPGAARAQSAFTYAGKPIHPACVHAVAMHQGDVLPVTTAVNLEGCTISDRARSEPRYENEMLVFEDEALLGGGTFGYREIGQLKNGVFGLAIRRVLPDGSERVSLAAVNLVPRAMMQHSKIIKLMMIELLGEVWIPGMDLRTMRISGNRVHFVAGEGPNRVERDADFTRLGRLRR